MLGSVCCLLIPVLLFARRLNINNRLFSSYSSRVHLGFQGREHSLAFSLPYSVRTQPSSAIAVVGVMGPQLKFSLSSSEITWSFLNVSKQASFGFWKPSEPGLLLLEGPELSKSALESGPMWAARLILFPWEPQLCSQRILSQLDHSSEEQDRHSQEVKARVIGRGANFGKASSDRAAQSAG